MTDAAAGTAAAGERRNTQAGGAALVAAGIFLSRIMGLVRSRLFTQFLGISDSADAFSAALKIPNFLQNLFGEGVLSASFIPVYARLLAEGDEEEAGRVAGAVFSLLALTATVLVTVGVLATPWLIDLLTPGFTGDKRLLTVKLVQVMFPGVGLLVISAWCLGILNSHRRFFLSYASPVAWNLMMIGALLLFGGRVVQANLVMLVAVASVAGAALQVAVQLPVLFRVERKLRVSLSLRVANVRVVIANFVPVFFGRGVVQISGYVDQWLASYLIDGAVAVLSYAQNVSMLPISLFGMAIAASELPAMSSAIGGSAEVASEIRRRLDAGLRRVAFYIIPSAAAFLLLGDIIAGVLYQGGAFKRDGTVWVWAVLAGSAVGLLAGTMGRLYSSAWYAQRDTRTPLKFAMFRVALTFGLGYVSALHLPGWLGISPRWGVAGLTASAGVAGWMEFWLLRRSMNRRIGVTGVPLGRVAVLWGAALVAAIPALGVKLAMGVGHPVYLAAASLPLFALTYLFLTGLARVPEAAEFTERISRVIRRAG
ncbi:MAG TPA: murein biosynthesis integral membrane protein MurJ [Gemmatimonadaceae bacterium]